MATLEDIMKAIRENDVNRLGGALDENPELARARTAEGGSAFLTALYYGRTDMAAQLRARGAELNAFEAAAAGDLELLARHLDEDPALLRAYSHDGWTVLHLAAFFGHVPCVGWLLGQGADQTIFSRGHEANLPLHAAAAASRSEVCRLLVEAGSDPNARAGGGWTPLHIAAGNGNLELLDMLLAHGADPELRKDDGQTAEETAAAEGHAAVAERLHLHTR